MKFVCLSAFDEVQEVKFLEDCQNDVCPSFENTLLDTIAAYTWVII